MQFSAPPLCLSSPFWSEPCRRGGFAAPGRGGSTDHAILVHAHNGSVPSVPQPSLAQTRSNSVAWGRWCCQTAGNQRQVSFLRNHPAIIAGRPCPYPYSSGGSAVRKPSTVGNNASIICTSAATRLSHNSLQNCSIATLQHCNPRWRVANSSLALTRDHSPPDPQPRNMTRHRIARRPP